MGILFYFGILILGAMFAGKLVRLLKLPNVTGYLLAGLLFGPYVLNIIPLEIVESASIISEMALAFIAFSIGTEFKISYFKKVGVAPIIIAICEGVFAMACVTLTLLAFGFNTEISLVLGAIASATAPAATVMVINQYRAKGPLTSTLLSVVAVDDAIALVCFGFAVAIVNSMASSSGAFQITDLLSPIYEVGISVVLGGILGFLMVLPFAIFKKKSSFLCISIAFIFIADSVAAYIGGSTLLTCMAMGGVYINLHKNAEKVIATLSNITPPIYMLFFALSGAELDWRILPSIGLIGVIYVVMRVVGKIGGASLGCMLTKQEKTVTKNLGLALTPQAGVALGLSMLASTLLPESGSMIRTVILCGTFIYEMIGPVLAKLSLKNAGEISEPKTAVKKPKAKANA
ncbi:MAG: cation:proton antiporter [Bacillota bacterium]